MISLLLSICFPILPKYVENPVFIATAVAFPLITLVPIKHILEIENISLVLLNLFVFSTGALSPVNTDWFKNKSLFSIIITSAGIIDPAFSWIISPFTTFSVFIVCGFPFLITVAVENISLFSFLLNLYVE